MPVLPEKLVGLVSRWNLEGFKRQVCRRTCVPIPAMLGCSARRDQVTVATPLVAAGRALGPPSYGNAKIRHTLTNVGSLVPQMDSIFDTVSRVEPIGFRVKGWKQKTEVNSE